MVIADINIVCVGQREKSKYIISNAGIDCYCLDVDKKDCIYDDKYQKIQNIKGVWYQIYPEARNEGDYNQEFMDLCVIDDKVKMIFLDKDIKKKLLDFLELLYKESPLKCIYFVVDLQGYKENSICISYREFSELIQKEEIYFNTVYYIT